MRTCPTSAASPPPTGDIVFSINDFDETLPGPFEWDVKRLVASFAVAGRDRGFDDKQREAVNLAVGRGYRQAITRFAEMRNLDLWYSRIDVEELIAQAQQVGTAEQIKRAEKNLAKTRTKDSLKAFGKLTEVVDGELRIVSDPPVITPVEEVVGEDNLHRIEELFRVVIRTYRRTLAGDRRRLLERFRYVHAARKVVGVGSVGTRAWIMLLLGRDGDDPLFLQFKEAEASVLEPFLGKSEFANHGQRVVEGQRLTQAASDILLGWIRTDQALDGVKRDFYVRQLWDAKGSARSSSWIRPRSASTRRSVAPSSHARTPGREMQSPSRATWARRTPSTAPSLSSPSRTRIRTNATTRSSRKPRATGGSRRRQRSSAGRGTFGDHLHPRVTLRTFPALPRGRRASNIG